MIHSAKKDLEKDEPVAKAEMLGDRGHLLWLNNNYDMTHCQVM